MKARPTSLDRLKRTMCRTVDAEKRAKSPDKSLQVTVATLGVTALGS